MRKTDYFWKTNTAINYQPTKVYPIRDTELIKRINELDKTIVGIIIGFEIDYENNIIGVYTNE